MILLHSWQEFLENSDLVCIKIIEEFRPRKPGDFGILLKNFKNSAAHEVENCPLLHFISWHFSSFPVENLNSLKIRVGIQLREAANFG